jgi:hypothetical protein
MNQLEEIKSSIEKMLRIRSDTTVEEEAIKPLINDAKIALAEEYGLDQICDIISYGDVSEFDKIEAYMRNLGFIYLVDQVYEKDSNQTGEEILSKVKKQYICFDKPYLKSAISWALDADKKEKRKISKLFEEIRNVGK